MFKIDRDNPWPPAIDFTTMRRTLRQLEQDTAGVPQFAEVTRALQDTLDALDQVEAKHPSGSPKASSPTPGS